MLLPLLQLTFAHAELALAPLDVSALFKSVASCGKLATDCNTSVLCLATRRVCLRYP